MKTKTIILMVVAVVCGLGASYMTSRLLADRGTPPPPTNTVKVLVAKQKIAAWTPIKEPDKLFYEKEVPEGTFSPKCINSYDDLKNQALKQPLNADLPVTKDDLLSSDTSNILAQLKDGERAVALKVNTESLVGGFVLPGNRVDVALTIKRGDADSRSQIIMQKMLVLAVDQKYTREDETKTIIGSTVTLAATADQAKELTLAATMGELRLLLRNPGDTEELNTKPVYLADLGKKHDQPEDKAEPDKPDPAKPTGPGGINLTPPSEKKDPPAPEPPKPVEDPAITHTLRIEQGDSVSKAVFTWNKDKKRWAGGGRNGDEDAAPAGPPPAPPAPPKPAEGGKPAEGPVG